MDDGVGANTTAIPSVAQVRTMWSTGMSGEQYASLTRGVTISSYTHMSVLRCFVAICKGMKMFYRYRRALHLYMVLTRSVYLCVVCMIHDQRTATYSILLLYKQYNSCGRALELYVKPYNNRGAVESNAVYLCILSGRSSVFKHAKET